MSVIEVFENDAVVTVVATSDGQTDFDFDFLAYSGEQIKAKFKDVSAGTTQDLTFNADFTVTGLGVATGGTISLVTLGANVVIGDEVQIYRDTAIQRLTDFQQSGDYFADTVNREEDTEFMIMQELRRDVNRSLKVALGETAVEFPEAVAGSLIAYDAAGNLVTTPSPVSGSTLIGNPAGDGWILGTVPTDAVILSTNTTFRVPSDFATLEAAFQGVQKYLMENGAKITILLESGYEWPANIALTGCDLSHVTLSSDDATVNTAATFPANDALITFTYCRPPIWNILVDMQGRGDNGVEYFNTRLHVIHRKGCINAGANGSPHREAWGSNFVGLGASHLFCDPERQTVVTTTGHTAAGGTTTTFPLAAADQQPDGYYIGHVINVSNGTDTTDADIIDYDNATNTVTLRYADRWTAANDGAGLSYTIDLLRGLMASGGARRGLTNTWGSGFSCVAADFTNCGTDARDAGHCSIFHRRGSYGQADRSIFTGSVCGVRASRANTLSTREAYYSRIAGSCITAAENAMVSAATSAFVGSGLATGGTPLPLLLLSSNEGRGGSASIDGAGGEYDRAVSPVARIDAEAGKIDLGDARAFEIEDYFCTADGGEIDCTRANGTTSATAGATHVILASSLSASVPALSFTWDAQNGAAYVFRAVNMGKGSLANANISNATTQLLDIDEGATVYFESTTLGGVTVGAADGFTVGPNASIRSLSDAQQVIQAGWFVGDNVTFDAAGARFIGRSGATGLANMPDVDPVDPTPNHWAENSNPGTTDMGTALVAWGAYGGSLTTRAEEYATSVAVPVPANTCIAGPGKNAATIRQTTWGLPALDVQDANNVEISGLSLTSTETKSVLATGISTYINGGPVRSYSAGVYTIGSDFVRVHDCHFDGFVSGVQSRGGQTIWRENVTIAGGTTTTFVLDAADVQADDYYNGWVIRVHNAAGGDSSVRMVTDYDNATNTVTIDKAWSAANTGAGVYYRLQNGRSRGCEFYNNTGGTDLDFGTVSLLNDMGRQTGWHVERISETQGIPPHAFYFAGDEDYEYSTNMEIGDWRVESVIKTSETEHAVAYKFDSVRNTTLGSFIAKDAKAIAQFNNCRNVTGGDFLGLDLTTEENDAPTGVEVNGGQNIHIVNVVAEILSTYSNGSSASAKRPRALHVLGETNGLEFDQPLNITANHVSLIYNGNGQGAQAVLVASDTTAERPKFVRVDRAYLEDNDNNQNSFIVRVSSGENVNIGEASGEGVGVTDVVRFDADALNCALHYNSNQIAGTLTINGTGNLAVDVTNHP